MVQIATVRDVVTAFGGTSNAAAFLKVGPSAVSNMLKAQEIPRSYHLELLAELEDRGYEVDTEKLFGVKWNRRPPCGNEARPGRISG